MISGRTGKEFKKIKKETKGVVFTCDLFYYYLPFQCVLIKPMSKKVEGQKGYTHTKMHASA